MFEKLEVFLDNVSSPGFKGDVLAALLIMQRYGFMNAWSEISQLLDTSNDIPADKLVIDIDTIIQTGLNVILENHQINMDSPIGIKIDVLEGLKTLQDYEDSTTVLQHCDADSDPVQTLCDLLAIVTDKTWADFSDAITYVSKALIVRLGDLHREQDENKEHEAPTPGIEPTRKEAIKKHFYKYLTSLPKKAVMEDMTMIGTPIDMLIERYRDTLNEYEPLAAKQTAIDLVGLSLISDVSMTDFVRQTKDLIEGIYSDVNFITKVDSEMDAVFKEVMANG